MLGSRIADSEVQPGASKKPGSRASSGEPRCTLANHRVKQDDVRRTLPVVHRGGTLHVDAIVVGARRSVVRRPHSSSQIKRECAISKAPKTAARLEAGNTVLQSMPVNTQSVPPVFNERCSLLEAQVSIVPMYDRPRARGRSTRKDSSAHSGRGVQPTENRSERPRTLSPAMRRCASSAPPPCSSVPALERTRPATARHTTRADPTNAALAEHLRAASTPSRNPVWPTCPTEENCQKSRVFSPETHAPGRSRPRRPGSRAELPANSAPSRRPAPRFLAEPGLRMMNNSQGTPVLPFEYSSTDPRVKQTGDLEVVLSDYASIVPEKHIQDAMRKMFWRHQPS